jgi:hypothetical protein
VQTKTTSDYIYLPHPNLQHNFREHTANDSNSGKEYSDHSYNP